MIKEIRISELIPFENNPFQTREDMEFEMLVDSIAENGIINPIIVRKASEGYEVISGQRRILAAELLGLESVPATVKELDRDQAIIMMVDANLQREHVLPSEKAFAFKMKHEAMKRQGTRNKEGGHNVHKSRDDVSETKSGRQVQRYIRLTELIPPLLRLVDEKRIAMTPAVELSYLAKELQESLYETILSEDATPSLSQAKRMRKLEISGKLTDEAIFDIMSEIKGNQVETIKLPLSDVRRYFKKDVSPSEMKDVIIKALDDWHRKMQRKRDDYSR